jgi:hypothetical protein
MCLHGHLRLSNRGVPGHSPCWLPRDPAGRRFQHCCETGDPVALGDVFDRTAGHLMREALWLGGTRADAEGLLQRTVDSTDPWAL